MARHLEMGLRAFEAYRDGLADQGIHELPLWEALETSEQQAWQLAAMALWDLGYWRGCHDATGEETEDEIGPMGGCL